MSKKIIGVYPMFNTGGICVHAIDDAEDKVLASVNGENPEWCEMAEQPQEDGDEMESGFLFGSFFVAFSGVIPLICFFILRFAFCSRVHHAKSCFLLP